MAETTNYYCPNGCTHSNTEVYALLVVTRDRFGYRDGNRCQVCGGTWTDPELRSMDADATTPFESG